MKDINLEELGKYGIITLIISKEWIETKYLEEIDRTFKILPIDLCICGNLRLFTLSRPELSTLLN